MIDRYFGVGALTLVLLSLTALILLHPGEARCSGGTCYDVGRTCTSNARCGRSCICLKTTGTLAGICVGTGD